MKKRDLTPGAAQEDKKWNSFKFVNYFIRYWKRVVQTHAATIAMSPDTLKCSGRSDNSKKEKKKKKWHGYCEDQNYDR